MLPIWLIPLLPFLGFLSNALLIWHDTNEDRRKRNAGYVATGAVLLAFAVALVDFIQLAMRGVEDRRIETQLWEWINIGNFQVHFGLLLDPLSAVMILLVTGVGGLIHIYSIGYMHGDKRVGRYFAYLNLFITMMLLLVMADNLMVLFLGWEGVGLCSFLLIGHWYERRTASAAAVKAFVVNRIGDAAMLLAMMAIFSKFGTLSFFAKEGKGFIEQSSLIAGQMVNFPGEQILVSTAISFLLLIAVTGKSAQIPLFIWLPDAMEGPTPVSALIHAATMVTAGVYLIVRTHVLFTPATLGWVTWIGALTALVGATAAIPQNDIKRVLAYSTVSQLGYMVAAAGMGIYAIAIFHLLTHGVFKALLFLGSGSVIHGTHERQDMRKMGGLRDKMPTTFKTYAIGAGALAGIFPLAGFWSKDEILAHAWTSGYAPIYFILFISSLSTAFYMGRQVALVFYGQQRDPTYHAHESSSTMTIPLVILAFGAVLAGIMNLPGLHTLTTWLEPVLHEEAGHFGPTEITLAIITTLLALGSGYFGWSYYVKNQAKVKLNDRDPLHRYSGDIWDLMEDAWFFNDFYEKYTVVPIYRSLANFLARIFDPEGIDGIVNGVGRVLNGAAFGVRTIQSGYLRNYALMFLVGVVVVLGFLVTR